MGLLRKVTGKTVSRKDATTQRKTFLHFDLILNRKDAKSAKGSFIALRAGYLLRLFTMRLMPSFIISSDFFDVFHLFSCLN
jgi:hypothetical protein